MGTYSLDLRSVNKDYFKWESKFKGKREVLVLRNISVEHLVVAIVDGDIYLS